MSTASIRTQTTTRAFVRRFVAASLVALVVGALALPVGASAATGQGSDPTQAQYGVPHDPKGDTGTGVAGSGSGATGSGLGGNVGPLPFTGFDVIAMAAVALAVTGLGLGLQRAVARRPSD